MSLLKTIEDQVVFGFTGRVNLLKKENGQFLGVIYLEDGIIVGCSYRGNQGKNSFIKMIFDDMQTEDDFKFVVEPEIISDQHKSMSENLPHLKLEVQKLYEEYKKVEHLIPPMEIKLVGNGCFIEKGSKISDNEFKILETMTDFCLVKEIYENCELFDHEVTLGLISLRKKNAIKVYS